MKPSFSLSISYKILANDKLFSSIYDINACNTSVRLYGVLRCLIKFNYCLSIQFTNAAWYYESFLIKSLISDYATLLSV